MVFSNSPPKMLSLSHSKQPGLVSNIMCSYSGRSSSAGSGLVESSNCKVFHSQQGLCDGYNACHTPRAMMVCSAFHSIQAVVSQGWCIVTAPPTGTCTISDVQYIIVQGCMPGHAGVQLLYSNQNGLLKSHYAVLTNNCNHIGYNSGLQTAGIYL